MTEVSADQLQRAVEDQYGAKATLFYVAHVHEMISGQTVWDGHVHVFDLEGHPRRPEPTRGPVDGSHKRRLYAVLHLGGIDSPVDAVRAAIIAERKASS